MKSNPVPKSDAVFATITCEVVKSKKNNDAIEMRY